MTVIVTVIKAEGKGKGIKNLSIQLFKALAGTVFLDCEKQNYHSQVLWFYTTDVYKMLQCCLMYFNSHGFLSSVLNR